MCFFDIGYKYINYTGWTLKSCVECIFVWYVNENNKNSSLLKSFVIWYSNDMGDTQTNKMTCKKDNN